MVGGKRIIGSLAELKAPEFKLLLGLTVITVAEAVTYAWIEVLVYASDNPILYNTWIAGHYTTYHVVLALMVLAMIFGIGFVAWLTYSPTRFRRFLLLAAGNFLLWTMLEDEFFFIFSRASHTSADWTNWILGSVSVAGQVVPAWYLVTSSAVLVLWYFGLSMRESDRVTSAGD